MRTSSSGERPRWTSRTPSAGRGTGSRTTTCCGTQISSVSRDKVATSLTASRRSSWLAQRTSQQRRLMYSGARFGCARRSGTSWPPTPRQSGRSWMRWRSFRARLQTPPVTFDCAESTTRLGRSGTTRWFSSALFGPWHIQRRKFSLQKYIARPFVNVSRRPAPGSFSTRRAITAGAGATCATAVIEQRPSGYANVGSLRRRRLTAPVPRN